MIHTATSRSKISKDNIIGGHILTIDTISPKTITFFDSYGRYKTLKYRRLKRIIEAYALDNRLIVNFKQYQAPGTTICSHLSLYFLLLRARGYSLKAIQRDKFSNIDNNLLAIPAIIEGLLPAKIQKKRKSQGVRHDPRAIPQ